ncbi:hypothetical protein HZC07_04305 [Candidatus Micrarchaeota archaeon]|nr:hypothetical protein [Candidatus Micrarchaeota archaeon]
MRGYISFLLVLPLLTLTFTLLAANYSSKSPNLSKAIAVERSYSLQMNVKEATLESIRQGAYTGFSDYDSTHFVGYCANCPENFCSPPTLPPIPEPPNICDPLRCSKCFKESEAREQAEFGADTNLAMLGSVSFDRDFSVSFSKPKLQIIILPSISKNGFSFDSVRLSEPLTIQLQSNKLSLSANASLPTGLVIR